MAVSAKYTQKETPMRTLNNVWHLRLLLIVLAALCTAASATAAIRGSGHYSAHSLDNPYGAGSPYQPDGMMSPYSPYGSRYSNRSWRSPYADDAPSLYDYRGNYRGRWSTNRYDDDSASNPYGYYGSPYSPYSIRNPYGYGNPYYGPIYVYPGR
jgi:hypothetical protein